MREDLNCSASWLHSGFLVVYLWRVFRGSEKHLLRDFEELPVHSLSLCVTLSVGMKDGQKVVFHGEGDQEPGLQPGDIIIVLDQREHPVFTR